MIHSESHVEERAQEVRERSWMTPDVHTVLLDMNILRRMEMTLMVLRKRSEDGDQMNPAGESVTKLERARRTLGKTTRQIFTEDLVMIASLDSCKGSWHNQSLC